MFIFDCNKEIPAEVLVKHGNKCHILTRSDDDSFHDIILLPDNQFLFQMKKPILWYKSDKNMDSFEIIKKIETVGGIEFEVASIAVNQDDGYLYISDDKNNVIYI